jgi:hypothetical protein
MLAGPFTLPLVATIVTLRSTRVFVRRTRTLLALILVAFAVAGMVACGSSSPSRTPGPSTTGNPPLSAAAPDGRG